MSVPTSSENATHPLLSNQRYSQLKFLVTLVLPAFGAFYFGLAGLWGLPAGDQVVGTCALLATFFGVVLKFSEITYDKSDAAYDGEMQVIDTEAGKMVQLEFNGEPETVEEKDRVTFRVNK